MTEASAVDEAITRYLRDQGDEAERLLAATGESGVRRMLSLKFGEAREPFDYPAEMSGRRAIDLWAAAVSVVARAAPAAFVAGLAGRDLSGLRNLSLLATLGGVHDPGATAILGGYVANEEWLTRYNAVAALVRREDPAARPYIERAATDPELVVRAEAIKGISQWDPARAIALYTGLLAAEGVTPLLTAEAERAIDDLRAGRPVREPWD
jgi:hypothetical protein